MPESKASPSEGTYHIRLASMRVSWFPDAVRRIVGGIPDDVDAIVDLSDVNAIDRFSARALADAVRSAARRGVACSIATNRPEVRRALLRERVDQWASIAPDMSSARQQLGLVEPQPLPS